MAKDYCTWFPERWLNWKFELVDISTCCKIHDDTCSTKRFCKCLREKKIIGNLLITAGGMIGCIVKYPFFMAKKAYNGYKFKNKG